MDQLLSGADRMSIEGVTANLYNISTPQVRGGQPRSTATWPKVSACISRHVKAYKKFVATDLERLLCYQAEDDSVRADLEYSDSNTWGVVTMWVYSDIQSIRGIQKRFEHGQSLA